MKQDVSEIHFEVELDEKKMPAKINWRATEADFQGLKPCEALMIFLWDKSEKNTLAINLWTQEMLVDDMNLHVFQILMTLSDTYRRATGNEPVADGIANFADEFGKATTASAKD